jgi:type I restriction enzyme M protein
MQNWVKRRYIKLLSELKNKEFSFQEAVEVLSKFFGDGEDQVKNILSELKKAGLLYVQRSAEDRREKIYKLIELVDLFAGGRTMKINNNNVRFANSIITRDQLVSLLKQAADLIRTRVDYTFILFLLFYKAISDKWKREFEEKKKELLSKGWEESEAEIEAKNKTYHTFDFQEDYLWDNIRKDPQRITEKFSLAVKRLAELNPYYQDIFSQFDFHSFTNNPENAIILNQLVELFSKFSFEEISGDILGDAYEWILKYFAPTKAKEGEVYTPREVIRLIVEILDPEPGKSIYDPALGSGGMLIVAYKYVEERYGKEKADTLLLFGQEANAKTLALSKMNMLLHDIKNFHFALGDTLLFPKFKEGDSIRKFDYVIANPPWNQDGYDEENLKKGEYWRERFKYGFPTKQSADWAWIQHMLASAEENGKVAVVVDTGAVSRGGREKLIRQRIVEDDLVESVILLPEKLFYNTGAPAVVIVFNKQKPEDKKGKILLINASKEFVPGKKQNTLSTENIRKIVDAYRSFKDVEKLARVITIDEVREADYNLSPSRFVSVAEEEIYRDISEIWAELEKLEEERKNVEEKIRKIFGRIENI